MPILRGKAAGAPSRFYFGEISEWDELDVELIEGG